VRLAFVAESLWPETSYERSHACLRSAVWRLRSREVRLIATTIAGMRLEEDVQVDVTEHQLWAADLASGLRPPEASANARFGSELLPDWPDDWLYGWREAWHQVRLHALEQLARAYAAISDFGRALETAMAALRADPLRESAHRVVITVHLAEGNYVEARRQYEACSRLLHSELGVSPSQLTRNLLSSYVATLQPETGT
jgi:DNA-binding SARP family transcriptional activator